MDYENCIASECSFYSDLTIQVIDWKLANDECGYEEYEDPYLRIGSGRQRIVDVIDSERLLWRPFDPVKDVHEKSSLHKQKR